MHDQARQRVATVVVDPARPGVPHGGETEQGEHPRPAAHGLGVGPAAGEALGDEILDGQLELAHPGDLQADELRVQARDEINVVSANAHIDWAAAKRISLSTAGGANITIEGGNITVQCPGKIKVHAGKKSFTGPANNQVALPALPRGMMRFDEKFQVLDSAGDPIKNMRYSITKQDGGSIQGVTDQNGMISLQQGFSAEHLLIKILGCVSK